MAKRGRPSASDDPDGTASVRIDRRLAKMSKSVAEWLGKDQAKVLSDFLRDPVERAFLEMTRKRGSWRPMFTTLLLSLTCIGSAVLMPFALLGYYISGEKGRGGWDGFWFGILLGPFGLLLAVLMPSPLERRRAPMPIMDVLRRVAIGLAIAFGITISLDILFTIIGVLGHVAERAVVSPPASQAGPKSALAQEAGNLMIALIMLVAAIGGGVIYWRAGKPAGWFRNFFGLGCWQVGTKSYDVPSEWPQPKRKDLQMTILTLIAIAALIIRALQVRAQDQAALEIEELRLETEHLRGMR
jgi:hypothetical protein